MLETLPLIQHLIKRHPVKIEKNFLSTRLVTGNRGELQQILVNLLINAIYVMQKGGTLGLATLDVDDVHGHPASLCESQILEAAFLRTFWSEFLSHSLRPNIVKVLGWVFPSVRCLPTATVAACR